MKVHDQVFISSQEFLNLILGGWNFTNCMLSGSTMIVLCLHLASTMWKVFLEGSYPSSVPLILISKGMVLIVKDKSLEKDLSVEAGRVSMDGISPSYSNALL